MTEVDLRDAWPHEATDFTKWLAKEENLQLLSSTIGYDIRLIQEEAPVGGFSLDILAEEEGTGHKIIIENQLEKTDHDHLGKIITYASGHDAKVIVWIVRNAREEHRNAIDWLNEHTDEETEFYLIRIELWKIGDSDEVAPKFEIVAKPNDWSKAIKDQHAGDKVLSDKKIKNLELWNSFKDYLKESHAGFTIQRPRPQHWANASAGTSLAYISFTANTVENRFSVEFYIPDNKELYRFLEHSKEKIESDINAKLVWMPLPERKAARIKIERQGDVYDESQWESVFAWMSDYGLRFKNSFPKFVNEFVKIYESSTGE